ncbi:MAG TPA: NUDIX hydrolase [Streptosporangiaceae bacterium]|jgi:8-oxo-dGTP pyrophosphatase MutT (NUDIX family)
MPSRTFTDSQTWYAGLPTLNAAASALITDGDGRALLVKPNYRDHWSLPGGILEHGEPPHVGCAREIEEELGLALTRGPLLVLHWTPPDHERPRPFVFFVFDGGQLPAGATIKLQEEELDDYRFAAPDEFPDYLPPLLQSRVKAALRARKTGSPIYLVPDSA